MKLSILIPTLENRKEKFISLKEELFRQIVDNKAEDLVEIKVNSDAGGKPIGTKRNELLKEANGEYLCFFDDDDNPSKNYLKLILEGLKYNPDCCSLTGVITYDGDSPEVFKHTISCTHWYTENNIHYRCPNHLNVIRSS